MDQTLFEPPQPSPPADAAPAAVVCGGKRWIEIPARGQLAFAARCTDDFVPDDALVRVVDAIGERLDVAAFERRYPGGGRPAYHPRLLAKLLIYGMCMGVLSARELSRRLERDLHFMWLACELRIDHEVLSEFRSRFHDEIRGLFKETLRLGIELGLVRFGCIAIDGTKIAAAARRRALNKADLDKTLARLDERIVKLLAEAAALDAAEDAQFGTARGDEVPRKLAKAQALREKLQALLPAAAEDPQRRISPTDPEAPIQKTQDGKRPGYNAQIATDDKVGFIVAQDVTCEQNDTGQFAPMAAQTVENLQRAPATFVADTGYHSAAALEYLAANPELDAYIKQQAPPSPDLFGHEKFEYDTAADEYLCPAGRVLSFKSLTDLGGRPARVYRVAHTCANCALRERCFKGKCAYRKLIIQPHSGWSVAMKRRLETDAGKQALRTRGETVERTFGTIKAQLGLRQYLTRGLQNAQTQFCLAAIAVNMRKLAGWILTNGWTPAPA